MDESSLHERFREISLQRLDRLRSGLPTLGSGAGEQEELSREIHTLKGEARILGFQTIAVMAGKAEELMKLEWQGAFESKPNLHAEILRGLDIIESLLRNGDDESSEVELLDFTFRVDALLARHDLAEGSSSSEETAELAFGVAPHSTSKARSMSVVLAEVLAEAEDISAALGRRIEIELQCQSIRLPFQIAETWRRCLQELLRQLVEMQPTASVPTASGEDSSLVCWTLRAHYPAANTVRVAVYGASSDFSTPEDDRWTRLQLGLAEESGEVTLSRDDKGAVILEMSSRPAEPSDVPAGSARVMVIDDSPVTRQLLGDLLKGQGYEVREASHGGEALALIDRELPDLFLVDLEMPVMDGFEVLEHLQEREPTRCLPVIVFSSRDSKEDKQRCYDLGANAYLVKSEFREDDMVREIASQLAGSAAKAQRDPRD